MQSPTFITFINAMLLYNIEIMFELHYYIVIFKLENPQLI